MISLSYIMSLALGLMSMIPPSPASVCSPPAPLTLNPNYFPIFLASETSFPFLVSLGTAMWMLNLIPVPRLDGQDVTAPNLWSYIKLTPDFSIVSTNSFKLLRAIPRFWPLYMNMILRWSSSPIHIKNLLSVDSYIPLPRGQSLLIPAELR